MRASASSGGIAAAAGGTASAGRLERLGLLRQRSRDASRPGAGGSCADEVRRLGFEALLGEQRAAWAEPLGRG